jgi:hypothetical protein
MGLNDAVLFAYPYLNLMHLADTRCSQRFATYQLQKFIARLAELLFYNPTDLIITKGRNVRLQSCNRLNPLSRKPGLTEKR